MSDTSTVRSAKKAKAPVRARTAPQDLAGTPKSAKKRMGSELDQPPPPPVVTPKIAAVALPPPPPSTSEVPRSPSKSTRGKSGVFSFLKSEAGTSKWFEAIQKETSFSAHFADLGERDTDAALSFSDAVAYKMENAIAADPNVRFYILIFVSAVACVILSALWTAVNTSGDHPETEDFWGAMFLCFQVLITGGGDPSFLLVGERIVFFLMVAVGVTIISILIGLITDQVTEYMEDLSSGATKVVEKDHTLILGWNESTTRAICQVAFLRRAFLVQNQTWAKWLMPWTRALPSSPVAAAPIVVMCDTMDKEAMEDEVREAFAERGINTRFTKLGRDVIFRKGDPCNNHDLVRVAAHEATSILIMMNLVDLAEAKESEGTISNSATIRCVLALRNLMYSNGEPAETFTKGLTVVVQLTEECDFLDSTSLIAPDGHQVLWPQDLTANINSLMFYCAGKPGLSRVLVEIMDFDGISIRCRKASQLSAGPGGEVGWFVGKTQEECLRGSCWGNGTVIGVDDFALDVFGEEGDDTRHASQYGIPGAAGVMADPARVVEQDDYMVFLSSTSSPGTSDDPKNCRDFSKEAAPFLAAATTKNSRVDGFETVPQHVLLCGWRDEWNKNASRFRQRFLDVSEPLVAGSTLTCLNVMSKEEFEALVTGPEGGFRAAPGGRGFTCDGNPGVTLVHSVGNPVNSREVKECFAERAAAAAAAGHFGAHFSTAIVLGSVVGKAIPAASRDARVMTILLILRKCSRGHPMHVIAENMEDQTSMLALPPRTDFGRAYDADFVNTPAIIARSLTMNLGYPQIQDALAELVSSSPTSPLVDFLAPEHLGILGRTTTFGAVTSLVLSTYKGQGMPIGYAVKSAITLAPAPREKFTWTKDHRIVAITRRSHE